MNASWRQVLSRHVVPLSRTTPLNPIAAASGHEFFAEIYTAKFTGVAEIDATTGVVTKIKAFPDPTSAAGSEQSDQAVGAFDGRWLVWNQYRGETSFDDFTTWAWDSHNGRLTRIGAATAGANGRFWGSPWGGPDVRNGVATWVQGVGPNGMTAVHLYDLRSGQGRVVHTGHAQASFLLSDHLVVWPESPTPGAHTKMYVASTTTGRTVKAPRALRQLRGISGLSTDGRRVAYPSPRYKSLWWSPSLRERPHKILGTGRLHYIDNDVQISDRYIGFGIQPRVFLADTKTHRYIQISRHTGFTRIGPNTLIVYYASRSKLNPINHIALVPLHDLPPIPACS